jgi:hypothetical protein
MKYLKKFEENKKYVVDWIKTDSSKLVNKIIHDIKDICVELTDIGFYIICRGSMFISSDRHQIYVEITKGLRNIEFKFTEIYEYIEMTKDYLKEYPVEVSYRIDGINYNEEEYVYYTQRRIDKNHPGYKDISNILRFSIIIKLEDETYK